MPHCHEIKVRFYELDLYGHLNHAVYIQFFETGRIELLDEAGMALHEINKNDLRFVVSKISTSFLKPVKAGAILMIQTEILEIRRASSIWHQKIFENNNLISEQTVRAAITNSEGRPVRFPQKLIDSLTPYLSNSIKT